MPQGCKGICGLGLGARGVWTKPRSPREPLGGRGRSQGRGPGHGRRAPPPCPPRLHAALWGLLQAGLPATLRPWDAQLQRGEDRHGMATWAGTESEVCDPLSRKGCSLRANQTLAPFPLPPALRGKPRPDRPRWGP